MNDHLPIALYRAEQVRELDRIAIEEAGIPGGVLMARAGKAAFDALRKLWPRATGLGVVCGVGNNAGDGYVVARLAHEAGLRVSAYQVGDGTRLRGDARVAAENYLQAGGTVAEFTGAAGGKDHDVLVDALLGTGLSGEVAGVWREAIEALNAMPMPVLAIDVPSGLDANTGTALGLAVRAAATVTFIGLKQGLFTADGPDHAGRVLFHGLQVPADVITRLRPAASRITLSALRHRLARRPRAAHKGQFGHVLVVGGGVGMMGAARLAAEAALRVGAGLVSLATDPAHAAHISAARPELMCHGVAAAGALRALLDRATVIALGPGLGRSAWARELFATLLETRRPMVVDADALNLLAAEPCRRPHWILTPHPGEAGRLLGISTAQVQQDRFAAARSIQQRYGGVCVLKGAGSLVAPGADPIGVCSDGNPGMASPGMGDVLAGVMAGLLAQQSDPDPARRLSVAARLGVCVHARAGDLAAREGERGLLASDLLEFVRGLVNP